MLTGIQLGLKHLYNFFTKIMFRKLAYLNPENNGHFRNRDRYQQHLTESSLGLRWFSGRNLKLIALYIMH